MSEFDDYIEKVKQKAEKRLGDIKDDILKLAKLAENDGEPRAHIARLIADRLKDVVSTAWIYRVLPEEYKTDTKPTLENHQRLDSTVESSGQILEHAGQPREEKTKNFDPTIVEGEVPIPKGMAQGNTNHGIFTCHCGRKWACIEKPDGTTFHVKQ